MEELNKRWKENPEREIHGKNGSYKIDKGAFLGRGGFGIVYGGIARLQNKGTGEVYFREVAIKQFKRSESWKSDENFDKEVLLLTNYGKMLDKEYVLEVIDVFQEKESSRYFLITPLAKGGNLCEKMKGSKDEKELLDFSLRMAQILRYIHYKAMEGYRSKQGADSAHQIAIIHRDVKPQNIVFLTSAKNMKEIYLLDFGIAKIGFSDSARGYNNCGTVYYKAPEVNESRLYNAKVDVYSFGCTLYEMINDGERLMTYSGIGTRYGDRQRYLKSRLVDLQQKLLRSNKLNTYFWIQLLHNCLTIDITKRFSSEELLRFIENYMEDRKKNPNSAPPVKSFLEEPNDPEKKLKAKREIFDINFQVFRVTIIQDLIFSIFEMVYFERPQISKFLLYAIVKFSLKCFFDKFARLKERLRQLEMLKKYEQLKATIEDKRLQGLTLKAHGKIQKELAKDNNNNIIQNTKVLTPIQEMTRKYPELLHMNVSDPKRVLYQFCYQRRHEILNSEKFARLVTMIISYMQEVDYYDELRIEKADMESFDIEVLSLRKLTTLKRMMDERLSKDGVKLKLQSCRVQQTLKSNMNREQNKTDVEIERIS